MKSKRPDEQGTLGFFTDQDERWTLAKITDAGLKKMAAIAAEHSSDWQGLGVSLLHRLVMDTLLASQRFAQAQVRAHA